MRKRAIPLAASAVVGLATVLGTAAIPAETGCATRQCAGGSQIWNQGVWADDNTWITTPGDVNFPWISYGGNVVVTITGFDSGGRTPIDVDVFVGVTEHNAGSPNVPVPPQDMFLPDFAKAAGALATTANWSSTSVVVKNATCADYVMYAIVQFPDRMLACGNGAQCPVPPVIAADAATDGGVGADVDGETEGSIDGALPDATSSVTDGPVSD
ncbi:MAG TPA: hypothetical protein VH044_17145 [Polyangiaceae bacterium]|nr:hypothetical protein [Polyangiaceae bacterium]